LSVILGTKLPTAIPISAPGAGLAHGPLRIDSGKFPGIQEGMGLSAIILDILPKFVIIKIILQEERNERINMEIPSFQPTHTAKDDPFIPFRRANQGERPLQAGCRVRPTGFPGLSARKAVSLRDEGVEFLLRREPSA
jgi:hypothetical protein